MLIKAEPSGSRPRNNGETAEPVTCYTAIFGSHRNSCFKLERDGLTCCRVCVRSFARAASSTGPATADTLRVNSGRPRSWCVSSRVAGLLAAHRGRQVHGRLRAAWAGPVPLLAGQGGEVGPEPHRPVHLGQAHMLAERAGLAWTLQGRACESSPARPGVQATRLRCHLAAGACGLTHNWLRRQKHAPRHSLSPRTASRRPAVAASCASHSQPTWQQRSATARR